VLRYGNEKTKRLDYLQQTAIKKKGEEEECDIISDGSLSRFSMVINNIY
jgi:hypothetical protein